MDWYSTVFETIDMRSFSNLWFWIALAVLWSSTSHYVLGVPWDMVLRAQKHGGDEAARGAAMEDMNAMVQIQIRRILYITRESGLMLTGIICFILTAAVLLGWVYGREFAQAIFLLGVPMAGVWLLSIRTARQIDAAALTGEPLIKRLFRHRLTVQVIGMVSIFVTAMWGMYQNMSVSALGG
ncbi:component of SufBCD complex [Pelagivirga sediminicola]|uniref:Component of SufBCD complex n=1 Tax=Pelagivirga sediminicola TaxID=2170575 RepID=A0A2T7G317_9RHOB|nr:component of SufBCD complex [Pelagivirga sediminicola]PVA08817.1 component of SufBCD complex [Pelagivirga sediminicola]